MMKKLFAFMGAAVLTATMALAACSKKNEAKEPNDLSGTGDMGGARYGTPSDGMGGGTYGGGMYGNPCGGNPCMGGH